MNDLGYFVCSCHTPMCVCMVVACVRVVVYNTYVKKTHTSRNILLILNINIVLVYFSNMRDTTSDPRPHGSRGTP